MLEIDKMQERCPEGYEFILREYNQAFSKLDTKKEVPPNPPVGPPTTKELFEELPADKPPQSSVSTE